jgi:hypothetical protein
VRRTLLRRLKAGRRWLIEAVIEMLMLIMAFEAAIAGCPIGFRRCAGLTYGITRAATTATTAAATAAATTAAF